jgi:hypothetical protein
MFDYLPLQNIFLFSALRFTFRVWLEARMLVAVTLRENKKGRLLPLRVRRSRVQRNDNHVEKIQVGFVAQSPNSTNHRL